MTPSQSATKSVIILSILGQQSYATNEALTLTHEEQS